MIALYRLACKGYQKKKRKKETADAVPPLLQALRVYLCVMSADLVASLQIFDVMQTLCPCELSKKLCLALAITKYQQL